MLAFLSFTIFQSLLRFMTTESVVLSNNLILYCPFLLLPSIFPSIKAFSNEAAVRIWWPKYWGFSFNISPSNEYTGLISVRIDWCDLLAIQWTLRVFNATTQKHQFFSAQPSLWPNSIWTVMSIHLYKTTGKTIALNIQTFVGKVMSLLFNMLSRFVLAILPRSK